MSNTYTQRKSVLHQAVTPDIAAIMQELYGDFPESVFFHPDSTIENCEMVCCLVEDGSLCFISEGGGFTTLGKKHPDTTEEAHVDITVADFAQWVSESGIEIVPANEVMAKVVAEDAKRMKELAAA